MLPSVVSIKIPKVYVGDDFVARRSSIQKTLECARKESVLSDWPRHCMTVEEAPEGLKNVFGTRGIDFKSEQMQQLVLRWCRLPAFFMEQMQFRIVEHRAWFETRDSRKDFVKVLGELIDVKRVCLIEDFLLFWPRQLILSMRQHGKQIVFNRMLAVILPAKLQQEFFREIQSHSCSSPIIGSPESVSASSIVSDISPCASSSISLHSVDAQDEPCSPRHVLKKFNVVIERDLAQIVRSLSFRHPDTKKYKDDVDHQALFCSYVLVIMGCMVRSVGNGQRPARFEQSDPYPVHSSVKQIMELFSNHMSFTVANIHDLQQSQICDLLRECSRAKLNQTNLSVEQFELMFGLFCSIGDLHRRVSMQQIIGSNRLQVRPYFLSRYVNGYVFPKFESVEDKLGWCDFVRLAIACSERMTTRFSRDFWFRCIDECGSGRVELNHLVWLVKQMHKEPQLILHLVECLKSHQICTGDGYVLKRRFVDCQQMSELYDIIVT